MGSWLIACMYSLSFQTGILVILLQDVEMDFERLGVGTAIILYEGVNLRIIQFFKTPHFLTLDSPLY